MKKSFMTRALATGLSLAMAFSLSVATNVTTAAAAAKPAMKSSKMTIKVGQSKNYQATAATQKSYKISKIKLSAAGKTKVTAKVNSGKKSIKLTGKAATKSTNVVITFKNNKTKKLTKVTTKAVVKEAEKPEPPVEVLAISEVKQVASNAVNVTFTTDASKDVTKDNLTIKSANGAVELSVKTIEFSADGKSARVTVFGNFTDATQYNVSYDSVDKAFTASVGAVASITVDTASAEQNVATGIKFTLLDAQGIDVTPATDIDSHVNISVTGSYTTLENAFASKATITMNNVGDTADVTVTYSANQAGVENVIGTGKITCISPAAKLGNVLFKSHTKAEQKNNKSGCAKFYQGLKDETISVAVTEEDKEVYFCATDAAGDAIAYDSYSVESANDNIAAAAATKSTGKYARLTVYGNNVGNTQLNITATKNGVDSYYTIPVTVTKTDAATKIVVSQDRRQMSTVNEDDYVCTVTASLQDINNKKVDSDFTMELTNKNTNGATDPTIVDATLDGDEVNFKIRFANAYATTNAWKNYTFRITGADKNHKDATFSQNITVQVKKLPVNDGGYLSNGLTYQIELQVDGKVANVVEETEVAKRKITSRLYAICNGLFAGYVRDASIGSQDGSKMIGGNKVPTASAITAISGCAVRGVDVFTTTSGSITANLVQKDTNATNLGTAITGTGINAGDSPVDGSVMTFTSVVNTDGDANVVNTSSEVAEVGSYNMRYSYSVSGGAVKPVSAPFTVSRDYKTPTAKASTTSVDNISDFAGIIKDCVTTNVDMNNDDSGHESILGFYKKNTVGVDKYTELTSSVDVVNGDRVVVGYVQVVDNINATENWYFYAPLNVTFKQK